MTRPWNDRCSSGGETSTGAEESVRRNKSMKKTKAVQVIVLLALVGVLVPCAAQAADLTAMVVHVPFKFVVDGKTLPAGTYKVEEGPGPGEPPVVAIQTTYKSEKELHYRKLFVEGIPENEVPPDVQPHLVFKKVGDLYFLEKVVPPTGNVEEVR
jgi:hypothetical protein